MNTLTTLATQHARTEAAVESIAGDMKVMADAITVPTAVLHLKAGTATGTVPPRMLTRQEIDAKDDRIYRADCIRERSHKHGG